MKNAAQPSPANVPAAPSYLLPWLKLMRLPTVFTALTNILCGYLVSTSERHLPTIVKQPELWLLLLSSAGLYLGGMVLNDVFDAKLDAVERPNRPIPSGQISRKAATAFGALLVIVGLTAAGMASSASHAGPIIVASLLAVCVLLYDGLLKNTVLAPFGMGGCRFLNLMLGASCCGSWNELWTAPQLLVASALGVYVFGVTWFARNEAGTSSRSMLFIGFAIAMAGLSYDGFTAFQHRELSPSATGALIAIGLIAGNITLRCLRAIRENQSLLLQKTVGFMLLNIIFIDAAMTFCFTGNGRLATLVVILVMPATLMKRFIPMS
jgi:4-hydroxybenzoate polyprenyltransferase